MEESPLSYRLATTDEVYTNESQRYNMRKFWAYCQYCKFKIETDLAAAQCKKCNSNLITYIGHNDLAGSDS